MLLGSGSLAQWQSRCFIRIWFQIRSLEGQFENNTNERLRWLNEMILRFWGLLEWRDCGKIQGEFFDSGILGYTLLGKRRLHLKKRKAATRKEDKPVNRDVVDNAGSAVSTCWPFLSTICWWKMWIKIQYIFYW